MMLYNNALEFPSLPRHPAGSGMGRSPRRYKVLVGEIGLRARELCEAFEVRVLKGVESKDHVHILVSAPSNWRQAKS